MSTAGLMQPQIITVRRTELRQHQPALLRKAKGRTVLVVKGPADAEEDKYILDKQYFDQLLEKFASLVETLQIMADRKLFGQILTVADTLEEDLRLGKLHSFEEAFDEG
ncbi:MAG: hypothetical protein HY236_18235 [Acidobacteria bacterium]|nr:hypothetical protein [Acidobacteriota bacterium]